MIITKKQLKRIDMNRLTQIANECKTDKGFEFDECHGYTDYYENWLSKYENPKILEIGSWHGASTKMFNEYYNHNCEIWTYDISYNQYMYEQQVNVHNFTGDQNNKSDWDLFFKEAPDKFDIIIDDGSHISEHQLHTLYWLYNHLTDNGIYILEDLHTYMWDNDVKNSALYFLNFWNKDNRYLTPNQINELFSHLKDIQLIHIHNDKTNYCKRSITSILKFKL